MGSKILLVGCGAQGRVISSHLVGASEIDQIKLCDTNLEACKRHAQWLGSDKISTHMANANDVREIASLAKGTDVVVNAAEPIFNLPIMDAALKSGAHYVDLAIGAPYDNLEKEFERDESFKDAGRIALTGTGASPGISNVLAADAVDKLDSVKGIFIRLCDVVEAKEPIFTWSPRTLIQDCMLNPMILENGELHEVPSFSGEEVYMFPDPTVGSETVWYHMHEEPLMFARSLKSKGLKNCDVKMGGIGRIKALHDLGLLSTRKTTVKGAEVASWEIIASLLPPTPTMQELKQKTDSNIIVGSRGIMVVDVLGQKDGKLERHMIWSPMPNIHEVMKRYPFATHASFTIGMGCSLLTLALAKGDMKTVGVQMPEQLPRAVRQGFLEQLRNQKPAIQFNEVVEKKIN